MKVTGIWALGIIGVLALGSIVLSSDVTAQTSGPKLGFVDVERVLEEAEVFKAKAAELRAAREDSQKSLDEMTAPLVKEYEELQAQRSLMKPEEYTKKLNDLEKRKAEVRGIQRERQVQLNSRLKQTLDPLREKLQAVVEEIAKQEGYEFIFKRADLAYSAAQYDITDKVINKLNTMAPEKKETEKKETEKKGK